MRPFVVFRCVPVLSAALLLSACGSSGGTGPGGSESPAPASSSAPMPMVACNSAGASRLPEVIELSCVGGTQSIRDVRWSAWDSDDGIGSGTLTGRDCAPVCTYVKDTDDLGPVSLTVSKPKQTAAGLVFSELTITPTTRAVPRTFTLPTS